MFVFNPIVLLFVYCTVLRSTRITLANMGLSGETPTGDPILPAITGPFEVELRASFQAASPVLESYASTLFDYHSAAWESIWFGLNMATTVIETTQVLFLVLERAGFEISCTAVTSVTIDKLYTFKFGVDTTSTAHIYQDGIELGSSCPGFIKPLDVSRIHELGRGTTAPSYFSGFVGPLDGTISGVSVRNLDVPFNPRTDVKSMNFPGQPFGKSFVASFYALFDGDLSTRSWQRVFHFGNSLHSKVQYQRYGV